MAVLVDLQRVSSRRSDRVLFDDLSLTVSEGDRVGVVGINGTGKSTLLRLVAGVDLPELGVLRLGRGVRTGYLDQEPVLPPGTVRAAVGTGWEADAALERLGMGAAADTDVSELSGGQTKRVALARVLAHPAELLVLDEPTNHLDLGAVSWLEHRLAAHRGGLVMVSHDRHLLDRVTTRMLELDRGRSYVHEGGYASYLAAAAEREEQAASSEANRRNLARRELAWLRRGAPARTRKPRARIDAAVRVIGSRAEAPARPAELALSLGTPRLGDRVVECTDVGYRYGPSAPPVLAGVGLALDRRDRLGVVGANGTGKSTLLDLLAGRREPTSGRVVTGPTVVTGYYDQRGADLDPAATVRDLVAGPTRPVGDPVDNALMEQFWFAGALQRAPVRTLSGGERRRLQLLLVMASRPNVLFLDEPTNDLDLDTLRILEDFFEDWPGALVVVSHDRTFLDRTTERLLVLGEGGRLAPVVGGLGAWVAEAERRGGAGGPAGSGGRAPAGPSAPVAGVGRGGDGRLRTSSEAGSIGRQLRELDKEMARLVRRKDQLLSDLAAETDHVALHRGGADLAAVQAALDEAEERWLLLAEEAEEAE